MWNEHSPLYKNEYNDTRLMQLGPNNPRLDRSIIMYSKNYKGLQHFTESKQFAYTLYNPKLKVFFIYCIENIGFSYFSSWFHFITTCTMYDVNKICLYPYWTLGGVKTEFISIFSCPVSANISSLWLTFYFSFMIVRHLINFTYVFCRVIPYIYSSLLRCCLQKERNIWILYDIL